MITAPWGSGKTHYIQNVLGPFLKKENVIESIACFSLYSVSTIEDLCKGLFLQFTLNKHEKKKKSATAGKLVVKTVYNGMIGHFGLDFKYSEKEYHDLYSLLNLSKTLVVLEDMERSKIDIFELMGFVNNLTELDNVKVLLIVNEPDLIANLGANSSKYLQVKEKSVYDTIELNCANVSTIKSILGGFENKMFIDAMSDKDSLPEEIFRIMADEKINCYNFRSLKYALQKTSDLHSNLTFSVDLQFLKHIFLSILVYTFKKKKQDDLQWDNETDSPEKLGTSKYPLYKYCYDFLVNGTVDNVSLEKANSAFICSGEHEHEQKVIRPALEIVYSFYVKSEKQIIQAVDCLNNNSTAFLNMPVMDRARLYNYLLAVEEVLPTQKLQISRCKENLKDSFKGQDFAYLPYMYDGISLESDSACREWVDFKKYLMSHSDTRKNQLFGFDYTIDTIVGMKEKANQGYYTDNHKFMSLIQIEPFINMIKCCTSSQIDSLRGLSLQVYGFENISSFFKEDRSSLIELERNLKKLIDYSEFDSIQRLQIKYFVLNIQSIIEKLSPYDERDDLV